MFTSGFFNAVNHDRAYDALQVSQLFDGLIRDGIFASIGTCFVVTPNHDNVVNVGIGRAWFNHTWSYNDSILPVTTPLSEVLMDRIDAIVLEVNQELTVRQNSIKVIKGVPGTTPAKPALTNTQYVHQYPLAYIRRPEGSTRIEAQYIENCVGTSACPLVTGILNVVDLDTLLPQWRAQLDANIKNNQTKWDNWMSTTQTGTEAWLKHLHDALGEEPATRLQIQIDDLAEETFRKYANISNGAAELKNNRTISQSNDHLIMSTTITKSTTAPQMKFVSTIEPINGFYRYKRTISTYNATISNGYRVVEEYTSEIRPPQSVILNLKNYTGATDLAAEVENVLYDVQNAKRSSTDPDVYEVTLDD